MQRQHRVPQPSPCHWSLASLPHLTAGSPMPFMFLKNPSLVFCLKAEKQAHSKWLLWLLRAPALCHTHKCSPGISGGNKEKAFIAQGGSAQESKLIFLAYALCSGRQHTDMISLMFCSLKYL